MLYNKPNVELLAEFNSHVSGHIEAKKAMINLLNRSVFRHHQKYALMMHSDYLLSPSKLLLIGASGTGKTYLLETLHRMVDFPLIRIDATRLNPTGASGGLKRDDVEKLILKEADAYVATRRGYHSLQGALDRTVVFIDEIDKLGKSFDSSGNWNSHVQSNFLTLFDNKNEFSGVSYIFAGAFTDITKKETKGRTIGFAEDNYKATKEELDNRVVKAGLLPELVGRLTAIVELDKFTEEDYYRILVDRLFPKKQIDLAAMKIFDVNLTEKQKREMAKQAVGSEMGIRSLQRALDRQFADVEFDFEMFGNILGLCEEMPSDYE